MYRETFTDDDVFLPSLAQATGVVRDVAFVRCTIRGPAVIHLSPDCKFEGRQRAIYPPDGPDIPMESFLWPRKKNELVVGAIALHNCLFDTCQYDGIGWMGGREFINKMLEAGMFGKWSEELDWEE